MKRDFGAVGDVFGDFFNPVAFLAVGNPCHRGLAAFARLELHFVRNHECGVEADSELSDEFRRIGFVFHRL